MPPAAGDAVVINIMVLVLGSHYFKPFFNRTTHPPLYVFRFVATRWQQYFITLTLFQLRLLGGGVLFFVSFCLVLFCFVWGEAYLTKYIYIYNVQHNDLKYVYIVKWPRRDN